MMVEQILIGGDRNFSYLVADPDSQKACVIDPSYDPERLVKLAGQKKLMITYIFNTHRHSDHTNGNREISRLTGLRPLAFGDKDPQTGLPVTEGTRLPLGSLSVNILHTPGHTKDSMCLYIGDALFTGDTLFVGKVGGTDLGAQAEQEYHSLFKKILMLPDETRIYPGHNYGVESTSTIGREKTSNPFLLQPDFDSFVDLKRNWAEYKKKHGIA